MKTIKYLLAIVCLILFSCRKEVNERLTATDTQLVINSFISPIDDSIRVRLDYTENFFKENNDRIALLNNIGLASVIINDGISDKRLIWSPRNRYFQTSRNNLPILAGRKYSLKITTLDGRIATAETTVPTPITEFDLLITSSFNQMNEKFNKIRMSIKDEKGVNNYYRFGLYSQIKYTNPNFGSDQFNQLLIRLIDDNKDQNEDIFLVEDVRVINSANFVGSSAEFFLRGYFEKGDEAYYNYLTSTKRNTDAAGNPFAEPVTVYTNVKGGLGVFSSYQRVEKTIRNN